MVHHVQIKASIAYQSPQLCLFSDYFITKSGSLQSFLSPCFFI
ncbi:hypothetical protein BAME_28000 [Bacillus sp. M 2-6]|nr:hypothetical protein BAME_28000 [Bacillus sp. M 2-6]